MLIGTSGVIRTGKTSLNTMWTLIEANKIYKGEDVEVYANFRIDHPHIHYLNTVDDFMALHLDEMNGLCTIQEFQVWIESRLSGKEITRAVDKTVLQSGKLGFDILWDAQLNSSVDKRARLNTTSWFATRRKFKIPNRDKEFIFRYMYLDERTRIHKFHLPNYPAQWKGFKHDVLDKYDTRLLAELKRKMIQAKKESMTKSELAEYEKNNTQKLTQPDGDAIDKVTPQIQDKPTTLMEQLQNKGMEIVTSEFTPKTVDEMIYSGG